MAAVIALMAQVCYGRGALGEGHWGDTLSIYPTHWVDIRLKKGGKGVGVEGKAGRIWGENANDSSDHGHGSGGSIGGGGGGRA